MVDSVVTYHLKHQGYCVVLLLPVKKVMGCSRTESLESE